MRSPPRSLTSRGIFFFKKTEFTVPDTYSILWGGPHSQPDSSGLRWLTVMPLLFQWRHFARYVDILDYRIHIYIRVWCLIFPSHLHSSILQWKLTSKEEAFSSVPAGFLYTLQMKWVVSSAIAMKSHYPVLVGSQEKWPCSVLLWGLLGFSCALAHEVPHTVPGIELFCLIKMTSRDSIIQLCKCRISPCSYFFLFVLLS